MSDENPSDQGRFSAAGSALGYLVQVDYALLLALNRMKDAEDLEVSLETMDDIVFHQGAGATEALQSKHHTKGQGSLGDKSVDLWKSINNWIVDSPGQTTMLSLMSTTIAPDGSAAARLRPGASRDSALALASLEDVANASPADSIKAYCTTFKGLSVSARASLVDRISILDGSLHADEITGALELAVRTNVRVYQRSAFVSRLRGWWHGRMLHHLTEVAEGRRDRVSAAEIEDQTLAIGNALRDDNLPIDFEDLPQPDAAALDGPARRFVWQLQIISMGNARIRQCIYDHNRAYMQRSRWQRESLLNVGELASYDARLIDEWRRHFIPLTDPDPARSEEDAKADALRRFHRLDTSTLPAIRPRVSAGFVANGSLHMLADDLRIAWHPDWVNHVMEQLSGPDDSVEDVA